MNKLLKIAFSFILLTVFSGGQSFGQILTESFDGPVNGSVYSYYTGSNCGEDAYWIGTSMNSGCTPFPNITRGGDEFMTVNANYGSSIPGNGQIWSGNVNNWSGRVHFLIKGVHRFKSYSGNWPPQPVSFDVKANGQTIYSFTIPLTHNWQTFGGYFLPIPNNTNTFSVVQTGGACWNCDYSVDEILIYCISGREAANSQEVNKMDLEEFEMESINLYPNPATDVLNIDLSEVGTAESVSVFKSTGELILREESISKSQMELDISDLLPGTYFIQVTNQKMETQVKRFVKAN